MRVRVLAIIYRVHVVRVAVLAWCDAFKECFGPLYELFAAGEDCEARAAAAFEDEVVVIQTAIAAGKASYDGTKAQACRTASRPRAAPTWA